MSTIHGIFAPIFKIKKRSHNMNYQLTKYEMETIINYNDDGKDADVYTCNKALMRKLDRLCERFPDIYRLKRQDSCSKTYLLPKKFIAIRTPRILTQEQKQQYTSRLKQKS